MSRYVMRLDDACEKMDMMKWSRMENMLDKYNIKPLVGVIPFCLDPNMEKYQLDCEFWEKVKSWDKKGWEIALHGFDHVYVTQDGGLNPVNHRSEFAGLSLEKQKEKIKMGMDIFVKNGIHPKVFFAPSHTFDDLTLEALKAESNIRVISDTVSSDVYLYKGITFVPQQTGRVRRLPFSIITFCYHPNMMNNADFEKLEKFLKKKYSSFVNFPTTSTLRKRTIYDKILNLLYMSRRRGERT